MKTTVLATLIVGIGLAGAANSDSGTLQENNLTMQQPLVVKEQASRVPEPATMFLFGTGLICLSALMRRR